MPEARRDAALALDGTFIDGAEPGAVPIVPFNLTAPMLAISIGYQ